MKTLTIIERNKIEEEIIDTLCAWKGHTDKLAQHTAAARAAVMRAKELEIWKGKYDSFKEWLAEECDITEQWAYELIAASKVITQIEDAAAGSVRLRPLLEQKNLAKLRNLPKEAVKQLRVLAPNKAGAAALAAIQKAAGQIPNSTDVKIEVARLQPKAAPPAYSSIDSHPAIIALDNEWIDIKRTLAYATPTPVDIYKKFRTALEKALRK